MPIDSLCVYCGSNAGAKPVYLDHAQDLGRLMARAKIQLIYGGGNIGLMGAIANAVLEEGGDVVGVIPQKLFEKEVGHDGLTEIHVVDNMHQRKAKMADLADAFVALPGGIGTFEEWFEAITWFQLSFHQKACGILNTAGFYDPLIEFLSNTVSEGFVKPEFMEQLIVETEPKNILDQIQKPPQKPGSKWY